MLVSANKDEDLHSSVLDKSEKTIKWNKQDNNGSHKAEQWQDKKARDARNGEWNQTTKFYGKRLEILRQEKWRKNKISNESKID